MTVTAMAIMEARRAWTAAEDRKLRRAAEAVLDRGRGAGPMLAELARELGRTYGATRKRAHKLQAGRYRDRIKGGGK